MQTETLAERCRRIIEECNTVRGWQLTQDTVELYVRRINHLVTRPELSDLELSVVCNSYHEDHDFVEALVNPGRSEHQEAWEAVRVSVRRALLAKDLGAILSHSALSVDDLVQDALADVWRGIRHFEYRSRLQTWLFTVVTNCLHRAQRSLATRKRGQNRTAVSLDAARGDGEELPIPAADSGPEETVLVHLLEKLLVAVLDRQADKRIGLVYRLWAFEELSMREIGQRVNLSAARVHALVAQALAALRSEAALRAWVEDPGGTTTSESSGAAEDGTRTEG